MYYRKRGMDWSNAKAAENREDLRALARRRIAPGLIAYDDGTPVGWVGLAPRSDYARLDASKVLAPVDDMPVWSIVCFVVSAKSRGKGVATALLAGAIDYARRHKAKMIEAYPVATERGRVSAAAAYNGSQSMFERAGFAVVDRRQWNATSPVRPIMRLDLGAS